MKYAVGRTGFYLPPQRTRRAEDTRYSQGGGLSGSLASLSHVLHSLATLLLALFSEDLCPPVIKQLLLLGPCTRRNKRHSTNKPNKETLTLLFPLMITCAASYRTPILTGFIWLFDSAIFVLSVSSEEKSLLVFNREWAGGFLYPSHTCWCYVVSTMTVHIIRFEIIGNLDQSVFN